MLDGQKLQIEFAVVEQSRAFNDYHVELSEYVVMAYVECIGNIIKLMTEGGIEVAIQVLAKAKKLYGLPTSPFQTT